MIGPTYSSPILGIPSRLHRHAVIAYRERIPISVVVLVARTLKALRYSSIYSRLLYIYYQRIEYRVA